MPIDYIVHKERRLVITTATGRVTFADFQTYHDRLLNDPNFNPEFNQLVDGSAVTLLDITIEEAKAITERQVFSPTSRRAFVATTGDTYGLMRVSQNYLKKMHIPSNIHHLSCFPADRSSGLSAQPRLDVFP